MKYLKIIIFILMASITTIASAQKSKTDSDYNLRKAYEVLNEERDEGKAMELVDSQLKLTPDNVDALMLRARLNRHKMDFAQALRDINHALKDNKPKKTGTQNSTIHW